MLERLRRFGGISPYSFNFTHQLFVSSIVVFVVLLGVVLFTMVTFMEVILFIILRMKTFGFLSDDFLMLGK